METGSDVSRQSSALLLLSHLDVARGSNPQRHPRLLSDTLSSLPWTRVS